MRAKREKSAVPENREFRMAMVLTIVFHVGLLALSPWIRFSGIGDIEKRSYELFRVNLVNLDPARFERTSITETNLMEYLRKKTDEAMKEKTPEPLPWDDEKDLPVPRDVMPLEPERVGLFPGDEKLLSDGLPADRGEKFAREVVEIAKDVGREKLEERRRRPSGTGTGGRGTGVGIGGGTGTPGDQTPLRLGYKGETEIDISSRDFSPTVPTSLMDIRRSARDLALLGPETAPISPVGRKDLSRYETLDRFLATNVETYHDSSGRGYFRIRIRPNAESKELKVLPKDIIFVLDASGSIGRSILTELKTAIIQAIVYLEPTDYFNVLGFQSRVEDLWEELRPATDINKALAVEFVQKLRQSGMTNIYRSLASVSDLNRHGGRPFIVALFSDGRANVGVTDNRSIINDLSSKTGTHTSIFSFGVGPKVNHYLLDLLSYRNKGRFDYAEELPEISERISRAQKRISSPILVNLSADYGNIPREDIYPKRLPDLFLGDELLVYGRYDEETSCALRIVGEVGDQKKEFLFDISLPEEDTGRSDIARQWAAQKMYELVGRMSHTGDDPEIEREIQSTAIEYGLQKPY